MVDTKWQIEGWGAAQGQIQSAIEFLCDGKPAAARATIAEELVSLVRSIARGEQPQPQADPFDRDEHSRESWARAAAHHIVDGALGAVAHTQLGGRSAKVGALRHDGKFTAAKSVR